jgi:hypothetical protein
VKLQTGSTSQALLQLTQSGQRKLLKLALVENCEIIGRLTGE